MFFLGKKIAKIHAFKRNGNNLYSFKQVLHRFYPTVPPSTIRGRIHRMGKSLVRANIFERVWLRQRGIDDRFLILEDDLNQIKKRSIIRRQLKLKQLEAIGDDSTTAISACIENSEFPELTSDKSANNLMRANVDEHKLAENFELLHDQGKTFNNAHTISTISFENSALHQAIGDDSTSAISSCIENCETSNNSPTISTISFENSALHLAIGDDSTTAISTRIENCETSNNSPTISAVSFENAALHQTIGDDSTTAISTRIENCETSNNSPTISTVGFENAALHQTIGDDSTTAISTRIENCETSNNSPTISTVSFENAALHQTIGDDCTTAISTRIENCETSNNSPISTVSFENAALHQTVGDDSTTAISTRIENCETSNNSPISTVSFENSALHQSTGDDSTTAILTRIENSEFREFISEESANNLMRANVKQGAVARPDVKSCGRKIGCMPAECIPVGLKLSLNELEQFYTITVNPLRHSHNFSSSTLKKFMERISCFFNYCRIVWPEKLLSFDLVNDFNVVQKYIHYQLYERRLNISTVVRTLTALINLAKYEHRLCVNINSCPEMIRLWNVQRQLSKEQSSYQLAVKAGLVNGISKVKFEYSHVLETLRKLRFKVDTCTVSGPEHIRILHDFVLLSIYLTSMCGRSKELRTLQLFDELEKGETFQFEWRKKSNVLVVSSDRSTYTIYENDFKTVKSHGPAKFVIDSTSWLIPFLQRYVENRKILLRGNQHNYVFVTATGLAFSSPLFTDYLEHMFEREVNIRAGTTKLRHAVVTHVLSLPESSNLNVRESLASLMRHSLKHQRFTYCDISRQDQTYLSRQLLNRSLEPAACNPNDVGGNIPAVASPSAIDTTDAEEGQSPEVGSLELAACNLNNVGGEIPSVASPSPMDQTDAESGPEVGDIVALIDGATTCLGDASIFLAKVIRFEENGMEALLMELRKIPGEESLYRAVAHSSWHESKNSLIFPVDVAWDKRRQVYELRSTIKEIYSAVDQREQRLS